jgi:hypothetical protein
LESKSFYFLTIRANSAALVGTGSKLFKNEKLWVSSEDGSGDDEKIPEKSLLE